jgi:hypothetical protein
MSQIKITDLIDNAVENALARREQALTTEETNQIKGGLKLIGPGFPLGKLDLLLKPGTKILKPNIINSGINSKIA